MPGQVLFSGPHIEQDHGLPLDECPEFGRPNGRFYIAAPDLLADQFFNAGQRGFSHLFQGEHQRRDLVPGQPVEALPADRPVDDQTRPLEFLEVLGGARDADAKESRQHLDPAFALGQKFKQGQPMAVSQGIGNQGELAEKGVLIGAGSWGH